MNTEQITRVAQSYDPLLRLTRRRAETDRQDRTVFEFRSFPDARDFYDAVQGLIPAVGYPFPQDDGTVHVVTRTLP